MNAARRSRQRLSWPRGLREPRPGYYTWDHPDGRNISIGRVPLAVAINEALAANRLMAEQKPTLMEKLTGAAHTVADLIGKADPAQTPNTAKHLRSLDKIITTALGKVPCGQLSVKQCADLIESIRAAGKHRSAQAVRSRLIVICKRGVSLGWMESNPAAVTETRTVKAKRGRLTLDTFKAIYAVADQVAEWLPLAMRLALVTGADVSTVAGFTRSMVSDEFMTYERSKTGVTIEVPLVLRMNVMGWKLADVVAHRTGVLSPYIVHHVVPYGNAPQGSKVHPNRISRMFTQARKLAGLPDVMADGKKAPTMHEVRSLTSRLYKAQGGVDVQALLGHKRPETTAGYEDPRGSEPVRVRVGEK